MAQVFFLIGCQRSGTTLMSDIVSRHPEVAAWQEPYFVWDWCCGNQEDDSRTARDATAKLKFFVKKEMSIFLEKAGGSLLVDKSPENSFRIPFLLEVYPNSKFINIRRDGRDVALSMQKEWIKRSKFVNEKQFFRYVVFVINILKEQPFWRNRFQQFWFEFRNNLSLNPACFLNKSRWKGFAGWGPRFPGWQKTIKELDQLQFIATQWVKSVEAFEDSRNLIPYENILDINYEDLTSAPIETTEKVLEFLGVDLSIASGLVADVKAGNCYKWKSAYTVEEQNKISAIQFNTLRKLGYNVEG